MQFKDLKVGADVFIFDEREVSFKTAKVTAVTSPHYDNHYGPSAMVVDITIDGHSKPFTFKADTNCGYTNNLMISVDDELALKTVQNLMNKSEQELARESVYRNNVEKCKKILAEHSPEFREKVEAEERFNKLESSIGDMKALLMKLAENH
jgi:hypothetical protein